MNGRRLWILFGVVFVLQAFIPWYAVVHGEWFESPTTDERWTIGLPWSPWYEHSWWQCDWEGLGKTRWNFLSLSFGLFCVGLVMLWGAWFTKNFVAELEAEKRRDVHNPPHTEV